MEEKDLQELLIKILGAELNEAELDGSVKEALTSEAVSALYRLSKHHDLAHIVASALGRCGITGDAETTAKFQKQEFMSVYRTEQMKYTYGQICAAFDAATIPYIPLKGSVIRPYYPRESMRTSCDIDILVKEEDLDRAIESLTQIGYQCGEKDFHDVSLFSPAKIHLELHFSILENIPKLDAVLRDAWKYAEQKEGSRYEFTKEFFMFHIFAHMSYHFLSGGCGIRPLMDVWIMEHKMGVSCSEASELLKKAEIDAFAKEICQLVDVCFSGAEATDFAQELLSYILNGGVYGTAQNRVAVTRAKNKNTFSYVFKRLFAPYRVMVVLYPVLKKCPILLPFCWVARFFKMLFGGKAGRTITELKTANETETDGLKQMRDRLGL